MVKSTQWIATIPTPSLANVGKIDIASDLLAPYSDLMVWLLWIVEDYPSSAEGDALEMR